MKRISLLEFSGGKQRSFEKRIPLCDSCKFDRAIRNMPYKVKPVTSGRLRLNSDKGFEKLMVIALCIDIAITGNTLIMSVENRVIYWIISTGFFIQWNFYTSKQN